MPHKPTLARIRIYPVKSLGGFDRDVWELDAFGLRYDRRWMIVGPDGRFMTQRDYPGMAEIAVEMQADRLILSVPMHSPVAVPLEPEPGASEPVTIWGDTVAARAVSEDANRWLGEVLQTPCRLVYMPDESARAVDSRYVKHNAQVAFSDGFPLLLTSEESLAELNRRLADPVPMDRFRPNLVVRGIGEPHTEDTWRRIRISEMEFHVVKPCSRCVIVTTDQVTGERGEEPLKTLATYRSARGDVYFGQNLVHLGHGRIRVGDDVQVLEAGDPVPVPETNPARASGGGSAASAGKTGKATGPGAPAEPPFELYLPESDEALEFERDVPAEPEPEEEPATEAGPDAEAEGEAEEAAAKPGVDDIIFPFEVDLVVTPEDLKEAAMEDEAAESEPTREEIFEAALEASFGPSLVEEQPVEADAGQEEPAPEAGPTEEAAAEAAEAEEFDEEAEARAEEGEAEEVEAEAVEAEEFDEEAEARAEEGEAEE
ncbi:MAG: MOSC domain-containing protein, partial [Gemmatimonadota bacterium]